MRIGLEEAPPASVEAGHLSGIFEEARLRHPPAPARQIPAQHGRPRLRSPLRRLAARARIAAVGLAALAAFGGAAYAGALPGPVQGKVADIARSVGLSLPGNDDRPKPRGGGAIEHTGGETGHTNADQPTQGNDARRDADRRNGDQANRNQTNGDQGNSNQGARTTTVQGGQNKQGTQGTQGARNEQGTRSGGSGARGGQQGNGAGNGAGNGNQNG
jgi:hypothetical protein